MQLSKILFVADITFGILGIGGLLLGYINNSIVFSWDYFHFPLIDLLYLLFLCALCLFSLYLSRKIKNYFLKIILYTLEMGVIIYFGFLSAKLYVEIPNFMELGGFSGLTDSWKCESEGNDYIFYNKNEGVPPCLKHYSDEGKECKSSDECESKICLSSYYLIPNDHRTGKCSRYDRIEMTCAARIYYPDNDVFPCKVLAAPESVGDESNN